MASSTKKKAPASRRKPKPAPPVRKTAAEAVAAALKAKRVTAAKAAARKAAPRKADPKKAAPRKVAKEPARTAAKAPVRKVVPLKPRAARPAPHPARRPVASDAPDMHRIGLSLPPRYVSRARPEYHHEDSVAQSGVTWQPEVYELAGEFAKARSLKTVVDIGCGSGLKLEAIDVPRRVGVDFGPNLDWCREHHSWGEWIEADFETDDLKQIEPLLGPDTVVICADVVEHLVDPDPLIQLWRKAYNAGSLVITSTPDRVRVRGADHMGPPGNPAHVREWQLDEYINLLKSRRLPVTAAGWTIDNDRDRQLMTIVTVHDGAEASISSPLLSVAGGPVRFDALRPVIDHLRATYAGLVPLDKLSGLDFGGELTTNGSRKGRRGRLKMSVHGTQQSTGATRKAVVINPLVDRFVMLVADAESNRARSHTAEKELEAARAQIMRLEAEMASRADVATEPRATAELNAALAEMDGLRGARDHLAAQLASEIAARQAAEADLAENARRVAARTAAFDLQQSELATQLTNERAARQAIEAERAEISRRGEVQAAVLDSQRAMLELLQTEIGNVRSEAHRLSRELAERSLQTDGLRRQISDLEATRNALVLQLAEFDRVQSEAQKLSHELAEHSLQAGDLRQQISDLEATRDTLVLQLTEFDGVQAEAEKLSHKLAEHSLQTDDLRRQISHLNARRDELVRRLAESESMTKKAQIKLSAKVAENLQLRDGLWRQQNATEAALRESDAWHRRAALAENELVAARNAQAEAEEGVKMELRDLRNLLLDAQSAEKRLKIRVAAASLENFTLRDSVWRLQNAIASSPTSGGPHVLTGSLDPALVGRMHVPAPVGRIYYAIRKLAPSPVIRVVARMTMKKSK